MVRNKPRSITTQVCQSPCPQSHCIILKGCPSHPRKKPLLSRQRLNYLATVTRHMFGEVKVRCSTPRTVYPLFRPVMKLGHNLMRKQVNRASCNWRWAKQTIWQRVNVWQAARWNQSAWLWWVKRTGMRARPDRKWPGISRQNRKTRCDHDKGSARRLLMATKSVCKTLNLRRDI